MTEPLLINIAHARAYGIAKRPQGWCSPGFRAFAVKYNLDYQAFTREGIPAEQLEATGDHFALQLLEFVRNG